MCRAGSKKINMRVELVARSLICAPNLSDVSNRCVFFNESWFLMFEK